MSNIWGCFPVCILQVKGEFASIPFKEDNLELDWSTENQAVGHGIDGSIKNSSGYLSAFWTSPSSFKFQIKEDYNG